MDGKALLSFPLNCENMANNCDDADLSEYVCLVDWLKALPRNEAKWRASPKLYTTTHVRASLDGQPATLAFVEHAFGVSIRDAVA